jgi:hypothetical protein
MRAEFVCLFVCLFVPHTFRHFRSDRLANRLIVFLSTGRIFWHLAFLISAPPPPPRVQKGFKKSFFRPFLLYLRQFSSDFLTNRLILFLSATRIFWRLAFPISVPPSPPGPKKGRKKQLGLCHYTRSAVVAALLTLDRRQAFAHPARRDAYNQFHLARSLPREDQFHFTLHHIVLLASRLEPRCIYY